MMLRDVLTLPSTGKFFLDATLHDFLADQYDRPFFLYHPEILRKKVALVRNAFPAWQLFYSVKANPYSPLLSLLASIVDGFEAASLGELSTVDAVKKPHQISLLTHPGKSERTIAAAVQRGATFINIESVVELERAQRVAIARDCDVSVLLRLNCNGPSKAYGEVMSGSPSKFGIDEEVLPELQIAPFNRVRVSGVHIYFGSEAFNANVILQNVKHAVDVVLKLAQRWDVRHSDFLVDFGLGLGVPYTFFEPFLDLRSLARGIDIILHGTGLSSRALELGRYLVSECGIYISQVVDIKVSRGKTFVITDGGFHHFSRFAILGRRHTLLLVDGDPSCYLGPTLQQSYTVTGIACTPIDILADEVHFHREPKIGDFIALLCAGAYGKSLGVAQFLSHPPADELFRAGDTINKQAPYA
jgi:diaminopimelate decarboxylase